MMPPTFSIELHVPSTLSARVLQRTYDPELDDVRSILADFCEAAEEQGQVQFVVRGFGQDRWPVDVRTDLLVFLEQLPTVLHAVKTGVTTEINFYEQGIERRIEFVPAGSAYSATCFAYAKWQPDPAVEELDRAALEQMLTRIQDQAMRLMEKVAPQLVEHEWVRAWLGGAWLP